MTKLVAQQFKSITSTNEDVISLDAQTMWKMQKYADEKSLEDLVLL